MTSRGIDILNAASDLLGLDKIETLQDPSENTRKLLTILVRVCRFLGDQHNWSFLRGEGEIVTVVAYETGTVAVVNGSTSATFTGSVLTADMVGRAITISGHPVVYRITEYTGATSCVLNRAFLGDTVTAAAFLIVQDQYSLATDFSRPLGEWSDLFGALEAKDPDEFQAIRAYSGGLVRGTPQYYTIQGVNASGTAPQVRFHPYPDTAELIQYSYQKVHPNIELDSDHILFPLMKEEIIISAIVEIWQRNLNDDARADGFLSDFMRKNNAVLVTDSDRTKRRPRLTMSQDGITAEMGKWNRHSTSVNWGSAFDLAGFFRLPRG